MPLTCPECGSPARITDRFVLDGAPGPVEHVKVQCEGGHWSTPPTDRLAPDWTGGADRVPGDGLPALVR